NRVDLVAHKTTPRQPLFRIAALHVKLRGLQLSVQFDASSRSTEDATPQRVSRGILPSVVRQRRNLLAFALILAPEAANPVAERFRLSHVHGSRVRFKPDGADLGLRTGERVTA